METNDRDWEKIRAIFFKAPEIQPSENLVLRVMDRISARPVLDVASFFRWSFSTFAVMAAGLFFISMIPINQEESFAFETIITKGGSPLSIQESVVQTDLSRDWMGLEAL